MKQNKIQYEFFYFSKKFNKYICMHIHTFYIYTKKMIGRKIFDATLALSPWWLCRAILSVWSKKCCSVRSPNGILPLRTPSTSASTRRFRSSCASPCPHPLTAAPPSHSPSPTLFQRIIHQIALLAAPLCHSGTRPRQYPGQGSRSPSSSSVMRSWCV